MNKGTRLAGFPIIFSLLLIGCGAPSATSPTPTPTTPPPLPSPTQLEGEALPTPTTHEESAPDSGVLPAEPQTVTFQAPDGTTLQGTYYPSSHSNAPVVVLMHWARGWQKDWEPYAIWLQNRGALPEGYSLAAVPEGMSLNVLTFDFRGFEGGAQPAAFDTEGWLMDARAAFESAKTLPGVDPVRVITIGASIGADGAVNACRDGCLGALSISPGGYLDVPYYDAVNVLGDKPAWCLASEGDRQSAQSCRSASGEAYRASIYDGAAHGMDLFQAEVDPPVDEVILEFLSRVLEASDS
jgi:dienelactone hydrolase